LSLAEIVAHHSLQDTVSTLDLDVIVPYSLVSWQVVEVGFTEALGALRVDVVLLTIGTDRIGLF